MADYKVVFRSDESTTGQHSLKWEPTCPALLTAVQVSRNTQTSEAYLQIKIRNISGSAIESVMGTADVVYSSGDSDLVSIEDLDVDLPPAGQKAIKTVALPRGDVQEVAVKLTRVGSPNGWSTSAEPLEIPQKVTLSLSEKALSERSRKLANEGVDPRTCDGKVQDHGSWWVCACGQANVDSEKCCGCAASKAILQAAENESDLASAADELSESIYQKAVGLANDKESAASLKEAIALLRQIEGWKDSRQLIATCEAQIEELNTASRRRTKTIAGAIAGIAAAAAAVCLLVVNVVMPNLQYSEAKELLANGQYEKAVTIFEELGSFNDSQALKEEAGNQLALQRNEDDYQRALQNLSKGNSQEALSILDKVGDYKDAESLAAEARYDLAIQYLDSKKYAEAKELFEKTGDYKDSAHYRQCIIKVPVSIQSAGVTTDIEYDDNGRFLDFATEDGSASVVCDDKGRVVSWHGYYPDVDHSLRYEADSTISESVTGSVVVERKRDANGYVVSSSSDTGSSSVSNVVDEHGFIVKTTEDLSRGGRSVTLVIEYDNEYDSDGLLRSIVRHYPSVDARTDIEYEERYVAEGSIDTVMMNLKLCGLL